jgi:hypothetical protein
MQVVNGTGKRQSIETPREASKTKVDRPLWINVTEQGGVFDTKYDANKDFKRDDLQRDRALI